MISENRPKVLDALIVFTLFALAAVYLVVTLSTGDPIWAWPRFQGEPNRFVVHSAGRHIEIARGSDGFQAINDALNSAISKIETYHGSLGVSEASVADYRGKYDALEVFYDEPITIHTRFAFGKPNSLLIPFSGRHSQYNPVFGGRDGAYRPGVLGLKDLGPLAEQLRTLAYIE